MAVSSTPPLRGRPRIEKAENDAALSALLGLSVGQLSELVRENIIPPPIGRQYDLVKCVSLYVQYLRERLKTSVPVEGNGDELGEYLGMTGAGVRRLVREAAMPRNNRGKYPIKECCAWYCDWLRRKAHGEEATGDMAQERMLLVREQRMRAEMERHAASKTLVPRADCEAGWVYLSGQFVAALGSFVARVSAVICAAETPAEARAILKREEHRVRDEISRNLSGVTEELRGPGVADSEPASGAVA